MKVAVIIPTYNEKDNVGPMLEAWLKIAKENPKYQFEIAVVDDYSPDGTGKIVEGYQKKHKNIYLVSGPRLGYGKALVKGYQYAMSDLKADIVIPIDSDFQWNPFLAPKLLKKIEEGFDVVIASRGVAGSKDYFNWFRKLTHWVSDTIFAYHWAGIKEVHDHAGAFKAIRVKGILDQVDFNKLNVMGFVIQMKTIYELSKTGAKFAEVAAIYGDRRSGESTTVGLKSLTWFAKYIVEYIKVATIIRLERSRQFVKFAVVGFIGFAVNALGLELFRRVPAIQVLGESLGSNESSIAIFLSSYIYWPAAIATAFGAELAIISNFTLNNLWTFSERSIKKPLSVLVKFLGFNFTSFGAIIIQFVVIGLGTKATGAGGFWSLFWLVIAIGFLVIPYNWFMYSRVIWKKKK